MAALVSLVICVFAASRLASTAISQVAVGIAVAAAIVTAGHLGFALSGRPRPKPLTAMAHLFTALGGFLLFTSFALG